MLGLSKDQLGGLLVLLFALAYLSQICAIPVLNGNQGITPRSMPIFLVGLSIPLSLWMLFPRSGEKPAFVGLNWRLLMIFIGLMLIYSVAIRPMGFIPSSTLFLLIGFLLLGSGNSGDKIRFCGISLFTALMAAVVFWFLMDQVLGIYVKPLPW